MDRVYLGTSGWTYNHWIGVFYPPELARKKWFEYFSSHFPTVEINASFYRIPAAKVVENWKRRAPEHFRFSVKVSRLITHVKKLKNCAREVEWFFSVFEFLKPKAAMFLVQLPPSLKVDPERIRLFSELLPPGTPVAFEFRNATWYHEETYALLRELGHTFCIHDMGGLATEPIVVSETAYIRFHGYHAAYGGDYPDETLEQWAAWIKKQHRRGKTIYGYFNNDIGGYAIKNCITLNNMVSG